jgi:hypothetical protein
MAIFKALQSYIAIVSALLIASSARAQHMPATEPLLQSMPSPADPVALSLSQQVEMLKTATLPQFHGQAPQGTGFCPVTDEDYESQTFVETLLDHWDTIEDPEVAIVNWQTGAKDEKKSDDKKEDDKKPKKKEPKKWYEKLAMRGYTQMRISKVTDLEPGSYPAQVVGDRSVGDNQEFLIRRARLIIFGDVSDHMGVYLQPDFAVTPPGSTDNTHFAQIRDWYADCYIDKCKVHRVRVGQSKVPYGWENMQSSSNRIPLDRSDPLNSPVRNERDLGVFYYWTPEPAQHFFKEVLDQGLKGSGNYGVFGLGCYNGQGGSLLEQNDTLHLIARLTLPMKLDNGQHVEASIQGYTGKYVVLSSPIRPLGMGAAFTPAGTQGAGNTDGILDQRMAATFVYYPQPFGFQAEWNVGRGPALNAAQTAVVEDDLQGGYAQIMYQYKTLCHGILFPFARYNYYKGGYKSERNAPLASIDEFEMGCEWQMNPQMELTAQYTWTDRTNTTAFNQAGVTSYGQFEGQYLRFQFQFNY